MKKMIFNLIIGLVLISCEEENDNVSILDTFKSENGLSYNESLDKWNELKLQNGNSYLYKTSFSSWTGFSSSTTIRVENGKIVSRLFKSTNPNDSNSTLQNYNETKEDLGSHSYGGELKTIDDYYNDCSRSHLTVKNENDENIQLTFRTNDKGVLSACGSMDKRCIDDCYSGVSISYFEWVKPNVVPLELEIENVTLQINSIVESSTGDTSEDCRTKFISGGNGCGQFITYGIKGIDTLKLETLFDKLNTLKTEYWENQEFKIACSIVAPVKDSLISGKCTTCYTLDCK